MTPNQRLFCAEYLKDRNATRAYMAAYPRAKVNTAGANGERLLKKAEISDYIGAHLSAMESIRIADAREIMEYYTSVMRGEVMEKVSRFIGDGVQEMTDNPPKISDRNAAAEKLAKLIGADKAVGNTAAQGVVEAIVAAVQAIE